MKYILATTYDVFGYLIPGIVATIGLCLFAGIEGPFDAGEGSAVTASGWTIMLFVCYLAGLLLQSGSDLFSRLRGTRGEDAVTKDPGLIDPKVLAKAHERVTAVIPDINTDGFWRICETIVQLKGKSDTLDIFIYREGLYRGLFGATALLFAGLLRQLFSGKDLAIPLGSIQIQIGTQALSILVIASLLACIGAFCRYRAFCAYRVRYCVCHVAFHPNLTDEIGKPDTDKSGASIPPAALPKTGSPSVEHHRGMQPAPGQTPEARP
jgi:hypothetical protein